MLRVLIMLLSALLSTAMAAAAVAAAATAGGTHQHGDDSRTSERNTTSGTVTNSSQILNRIPLKELRILVPTTPVYANSKAAVSVVFSRPVIKLGSNFGPIDDPASAAVNGVQPLLWLCTGTAARPAWAAPVAGRLYWVTTSILRFDPTEAWGNDLRCLVSVNPGLRSWDGAALVGNSRVRKSFNTSALHIVRPAIVSSAKAAAATNGRWRSKLGDEADDECPDDCRINFILSHRTELSALRDHLCLRPCSGTLPHSCEPADECIAGGLEVAGWEQDADGISAGAGLGFSVKPPTLRFDQPYALTLPAGVIVSNVSGPSVQELTVALLHGLRPFAFPFLPTEAGHGSGRITAPQVSLFVRHGIMEATTTASIQASLALTEHKKALQKFQAVVDSLPDQDAYPLYEARAANSWDRK